MTPAKLQAILDVDEYARNLADKKGPTSSTRPSANPAADLAALARM